MYIAAQAATDSCVGRHLTAGFCTICSKGYVDLRAIPPEETTIITENIGRLNQFTLEMFQHFKSWTTGQPRSVNTMVSAISSVLAQLYGFIDQKVPYTTSEYDQSSKVLLSDLLRTISLVKRVSTLLDNLADNKSLEYFNDEKARLMTDLNASIQKPSLQRHPRLQTTLVRISTQLAKKNPPPDVQQRNLFDDAENYFHKLQQNPGLSRKKRPAETSESEEERITKPLQPHQAIHYPKS